MTGLLENGRRHGSCALVLLSLMSPVGRPTVSDVHGQKTGPIAELRESQGTTVADAIGMTRSSDGMMSRPLAHYSPNGKRFIIVLQRGNLTNNTNDYSLLLWRTEEVFRSTVPQILLTMSSSSNRPAIDDVRWLSDNKTIVFLGERPGELHQVYKFNIETNTLTKLTKHSANILRYSVAANGDQVAYTAETPAQEIFDANAEKFGVVLSGHEELSDLLEMKKRGEGMATSSVYLQSYIGGASHEETFELPEGSEMPPWGGQPELSPDGNYIVMSALIPHPPDAWKNYSDPELQRMPLLGFRSQESYVLIDTRTGKSRALLDSPLRPYYGSVFSEVVWLPDSRSVIVSNVFLPLDGVGAEELRTRQSSAFIAQIGVPDGGISKITDEDLQLLGWDDGTSRLMVNRRTVFAFGSSGSTKKSEGAITYFQKSAGAWERVTGPSTTLRPEITWEEHLNSPPKVYAFDSSVSRKVLLYDPNPQFANVRFGKVEEIHWTTSDGVDLRGGLVYPPDYVPGNRYPLVIQTHGWMPDIFLVDGLFTTAFAAQPLASKGIMVLQTDWRTSSPPEKEGEAEDANYEGAIDYLYGKGLIDRDRVGIIGFSRTCYHVKYMLTHSSYHIAAASVTDGIDFGYFQYIAFSNLNPGTTKFFEEINGGRPPFGDGLKLWFVRSPGFNIDKVNAPLLITATRPGDLLAEWEWFAALSAMGKPVELLYLKDGAHPLQRPWDRMASQQRNVDWFCFWLKGEEDPSPDKAEQYARWRELRKTGTRPN
jgi:dipeptidyl aminopeptidase/acylaminoacyl peptidase